ncbi:hypothetical protein [Nocardia otitidiscaviarum]|uniref:hypothetical protein n=1 Tax=Nocardia otitidiscaviarum TaxID=1823 RepID=UPI0004A702DF|nr:hypothetical protein [Nocardia otitidiscaviarum]
MSEPNQHPQAGTNPSYPTAPFPQQGHPPQQYPQQPYPQQFQQHPGYQQPGMPPIVINNVANASAAAYAGGYRGPRKRQSMMVHLLLLFFTAGLGNIVYAWYVMDWNKKHGY